jgi:hypothetical protein
LHSFRDEYHFQNRTAVAFKCLYTCHVWQGPYLDGAISWCRSNALVHWWELYTPHSSFMASQCTH